MGDKKAKNVVGVVVVPLAPKDRSEMKMWKMNMKRKIVLINKAFEKVGRDGVESGG